MPWRTIITYKGFKFESIPQIEKPDSIEKDITLNEPKEEYIFAEERVVKELKDLNKPFIILMNSQNPKDGYTQEMAKKLSEKYGATVMPINCLELDLDDINEIFSKILKENMPEGQKNLTIEYCFE